MRCFSCHKISLCIICKECERRYFVPSITKRRVGSLDVISFFSYDEIERFLHSKHKPEGWRIYRKMGKMIFGDFLKSFCKEIDDRVYLVGVDEKVTDGYSHTASLTHSSKQQKAIPLHASLLAKNRVSYSGKSLDFRLKNPREFTYSGKSGVDIILIDDIITTGTTLQEAYVTIRSKGADVLFALTLADASR